MTSSLLHMVILFWVVMDGFGNIPIFVGVLRHIEPAKQRRIIVRELLIALGLMIIFLFFGKGFLGMLGISLSSLQITGGIILFMIALDMIFSSHKEEKTGRIPKDPLIVPLAVPAVAGPGILATLTVYGGGLASKPLVLTALFLAWLLLLPTLLFAPAIKKFFGDNGVMAVERLFGYTVVLIATQLALSGFQTAFLE